MLKEEKRRELDALVGKQNADALIQNMLSREKSAQRQGIAFKALDPIALDDIDDFADMVSMEDEVSEKASYKKQSPAMEAAEDPNEEMTETPDEENAEESLLTDTEIGMIADEVAKRLSLHMNEMKSMMHSHDGEMKDMGGYNKKPMRTKSDDDELIATLKAYTESQESFAAAMVDALEALDTRLKELSEAKSTFNPSATHKNVVVDKDGNMVGLNEVEQAAYRMWFQNQ
jgi:hypothetical protein